MIIFDLIMMFCYIFNFSFYRGGIFTSGILLFLILFLQLFNIKFYNSIKQLLSSLYFRNIFILYVIINIWVLFILMFNGTSDISFLKTFLNMFISILNGFLLFNYYKINNRSSNIVNYIVIIFFIQTNIQWLSFLFPKFREIIYITKSYETILKAYSYSGVRVNALSGSDFFGLSALYAFFPLIFFSNRNSVFKNSLALRTFMFIYTFSGSFFAGRTAYIGLLIALIFYVLKPKGIKSKKIDFVSVLITPIFLVLLLYAISMLNNIETFSYLKSYTFQIFNHFIMEGNLNISSLDSLEKMYIVPSFTSFILGDGLYTYNSTYYMHTDVGYLRVIFYGGFILLTLLFIMQSLILKVSRSNEKILKMFIFALLIILNFKGEVIVWNQLCLSLITIFSLQDLKV